MDAEAKRAFIRIAERVVLLADTSELRRTASVPICDHAELDAIVTDDAVTGADRSWLAACGELVIAAG